MKVIGIGEKKTPRAFISACEKFIYLEILKSASESSDNSKKSKGKSKSDEKSVEKVDRNLIKLITDSVNDLADENGWAFLGELGNLLIKKQPNFDPRNYGFNKMHQLIKSIDKFEVDQRDTGNKNIKLVYVRIK